jgi:hypothetical protein
MKNIVTFMIMITAAGVFAYNYDLMPISTPPVIDGTLDAGEWSGATQISFEVDTSGNIVSPAYGAYIMKSLPEGAGDFSVTYYVTYDENNLYIAGNVLDDDLGNYGYYPHYAGDSLLMCFNPFNDPASRYQIEAAQIEFGPAARDYEGGGDYGAGYYKKENNLNSFPNGTAASTDNGTRVLVDYNAAPTLPDSQDTDTGWVFEAALPWNDIDAKAGLPGTVHGIAFGASDFDANPANSGNYGWDGTFWDISTLPLNAPSDISSWNTLTLIGTDGCGIEGINAGDLNHDCVVDLNDYAAAAFDWGKCTDPDLDGCEDAR